MYTENKSTCEYYVYYRYETTCKHKIELYLEIFFILIQINAVANRAAGKGYENEGYYSNIQFKFCPIENIHTMRNSLQKLLESI